MRIIDNIREAEKKSISSMRRGMERAKEEWGDVERRIRQKMRIYPQKLRNKLNARSGEDAATRGAAAVAAASPSSQPAKPIISVHGRDVPEDDIDNPAA
jgi:hypothetical protein